MPPDKMAGLHHKIFPPSRSLVPRSSGGFLKYPQAVRSRHDQKPLSEMNASSTALLMDDICDGRKETVSRFKTFAEISQPNRIKKSLMVSRSVTHLNNTNGDSSMYSIQPDSLPGKDPLQSPALINSFKEVLSQEHRDLMALGMKQKTFSHGEAQTLNSSDTLIFEDMTAYQRWVESSVEPVLAEIRKQILISKPTEIHDYIIGYCSREKMGQPHPTQLGVFQKRGNDRKTPSPKKESNKF